MRLPYVCYCVVLIVMLGSTSPGSAWSEEKPMLKSSDIRIRDPYIVPVPAEKRYYMFGTTGLTGRGYDTTPTFAYYWSENLEDWYGPTVAFDAPEDFWSKNEYWAPEVHAYRGRYYMFATFNAASRCRGTQILVSDKLTGPYAPHSDGPITPADWECLDGTLYVDPEGMPWMIFCHEWVQIDDGSICAVRLTEDLKAPAGEPVTLFHASEPSWVKPFEFEGRPKKAYVTDGPFMHRLPDGSLLMLWASFNEEGYVEAVARSESGGILGPWKHVDAPLVAGDGGHGMLFKRFDGQLMLTIHRPNESPNERPIFLEVEEQASGLRIKQ